jgi:hypothetical protein
MGSGRGNPRGFYGIPEGLQPALLPLRQARNGNLILWVLANVGFKDAAVGRMRQEFVPIANVEVSVLVPQGRQVKSVELVRKGQSASFIMDTGCAVLTLPVVPIGEVVHLQ